MKKFLKIFCIIFLILFFTNKSFSFDLGSWKKWFYTSISEGLDKLDSELYSLELKNNWGINEKIKEKSWLDCFNKELTEKEVYDLVVNWVLETELLNQNCKTESGDINLKSYQRVINSINEIVYETRENSDSKSKKTSWFSKIWIYSDWIEENWPFDLLKDLEKIDKIIFGEDKIYKFEWDREIKLDVKIKNFLKNLDNKNKKNNPNTWWNISNNNFNNNSNNPDSENQNFENNSEDSWHNTLCDLSWNCDDYTEVQTLLCKLNWNCVWDTKKWFLSIKNEFLCKTNTSWLNDENSKIIYDYINKAEEKIFNQNNFWNNSENSSWNNSKNNLVNQNWNSNSQNQANSGNNTKYKSNVPNITWNYKKVNDKRFFPCNKIFCINVEFKTYNHDIFWWWRWWEKSISFLLKRSNKHLKKFIGSSLAQAKMTINNFELWLSNVNLSDLFHIWVQISSRPVPFLSLPKDENDKEEKWELKLESQLEKYYEAHSLNYKMRNDLSAFKQIELKNQAEINSLASKNTEILDKLEEIKKINSEKLKNKEFVEKAVEEKARFDRISNLDKKIKEIKGFNKTLNEYVINLEAILKEMEKVPQNKSKI